MNENRRPVKPCEFGVRRETPDSRTLVNCGKPAVAIWNWHGEPKSVEGDMFVCEEHDKFIQADQET